MFLGHVCLSVRYGAEEAALHTWKNEFPFLFLEMKTNFLNLNQSASGTHLHWQWIKPPLPNNHIQWVIGLQVDS